MALLGLLKSGAGFLARRGVIRGSVGRALGYRGGRAGAAVGGAALGAALARRGGGPPPPPAFGPPTRRRQTGIVGAARRVVPGGRSGYAFDPYDLPQDAADKYGRPLAVHVETVERAHCPSGYVAVDLDGDGQTDACVLKGVARTAGLWKGRPKPPISGYDARAIRRANRAKERVKKLAQGVGYSVKKK